MTVAVMVIIKAIFREKTVIMGIIEGGVMRIIMVKMIVKGNSNGIDSFNR